MLPHKPLLETKYLNFFEIIHNDSPYYAVSRSKELYQGKINAVSVCARTPEGKFILIHEYRPVVDSWVVDVPSGLIDEGENFMAAAERELLEETGFELQEEGLTFSPPLYSSVGMTDERSVIVFGTAVPSQEQKLEEDERINVIVADHDQVAQLASTCKFTSKAWLWLLANPPQEISDKMDY